MRALLEPAVIGSILLAILSTGADYVWFLGIPGHQVASGALHGSVLFAALGAYLGWRKGQALVGMAGGLASGLVAALSFYALAPIAGYSAMLASWLILWILLATLQTHLDGRLSVAKGLARGIITALIAAVGFGLVVFQLYRDWPPATFSFFRHFAGWTLAYLPGLYVLLRR